MDGQLGACHRVGQPEPTASCGALDVVRADLAAGRTGVDLDFEDIEVSLIRRALAQVVPSGTEPTLLDLTRHALTLIERDLGRLITLCVGSLRADYAVFTGMQINAPEGNWLLPRTAYAVVDWSRVELDLGARG